MASWKHELGMGLNACATAAMSSTLQTPPRSPLTCQMVKGTSMAFPGFKKETDRADVIAYLHSLVG